MFAFSVLVCGVGFALVRSQPAPVDYYTTKYDRVDVDAILNNRRLVNYYSACMLSQGPCPPDGLEFKRILPDALKTNCMRCTEKQKFLTVRTVKRLRKEYPKVWKQLEALWDPDGIYINKFLNSVDRPTAATPAPAVLISNRFGDYNETNEIVGSASANSNTFSSDTPLGAGTTTRAPSTTRATTTSRATTTTRATTTARTTTTTSTTRATSTASTTPTNKINTKPTTSTRPTRVVGTNLQATDNLIKAIEKMVSEIYRYKMQYISRLLTVNGR
ncbi:uncharacterized protein LOC109609659 isoform X2 [Aethina tumida]|uniref:uncharacterized protein LOC109609659 isoform X2 n=1 Tax=Aethina tumida TaxID=116153 RepID=UPI00214814D5|nr:uncharacterized protein LOC109609659 isoform X2 [Aethina tumida]